MRGSMQAVSHELAAQALRQNGLWVHRLEERESPAHAIKELFTRDLIGKPKVNKRTFMLFCRQLATLYRAKLPLVTAVQTLATQQTNRAFAKVLSEVAERMNAGQQFSEATQHYPGIFPEVFISMARAGEESGRLDRMLERLSVFFEKEHYTRSKVRTALTYPAFLSVVVVIVVIVLMIFVVPRFTASFRELGMVLPLPTRIVIGISDIVSQIWHWLLLVLLISLVFLRRALRHPRGRYIWDQYRLWVPIFGKLRQYHILARFSRTFSTLHSAGVPIVEVLTIVSRVVDHAMIARMIDEARERLRSGFSMSEPFVRSKWFPPMMVQMLVVAESSGSFEEVMNKIAEYYEMEVDEVTDRLKSLLEPVMLLALAGVVGIIVMAIMLPTFSMINQLS